MRVMKTAAAISAATLSLGMGTSVAQAATKNGISPKSGTTIATGKSPTLSGSVSGKGNVYIYVSKSSKVDKNGLIGLDAANQKAKRSGSRFSAKMRFFDFPGFWLTTPGTYYWQAHRVHCGEGHDCDQEGPVVKITVR